MSGTCIRTTDRSGDGNLIHTLLDACQLVLEIHGEPLSSFWLASQLMEMKMWKTNEADVRVAIRNDIRKYGDKSSFVEIDDAEFAMRKWAKE